MSRVFTAAIASALVMISGVTPAPAAMRFQDKSFARFERDEVLAPLAFVKFCLNHPQECAYVTGSKEQADQSAELELVNFAVNNRIRPTPKHLQGRVGTWAIGPTTGDCNDYAVTKRHELILRGWPSSSLLLSDVETASGERHLVLTVRTASGDVVLDNLTDQIRPAGAAGYRWLRRQSSWDPNIWIGTSSNGA